VRPEKELLIDDFDGPRECPVWWSFGNLQYSRAAAGTTPSNRGQVLAVRGSAPGAFASGRGTFVDRDIGPRRTLKLDVRGYGPHSGRIKIELSEDDNGNWEIEKDPRLFTPLYDDRFIYELTVDWSGWRELSLPISQFHDDNPNGGNNQFDPARDLTSGGLLEMQLLFGPGTPDQSDIRIDLDNIRWTI